VTQRQITLAELNTADRAAFVRDVGFVFEHSPWIAAEAWAGRPFRDREDLHQALCAVVSGADIDRKLALIRAHPDLAGKAAVAKQLSAESSREQASAGLDSLDAEEFAAFTRLNDAYKNRFGFPFVVCVREHTKHSILSAFKSRLAHQPAEEVDTALAEIAKIARLRLFDAVR
jgi:OHCU decarboxylase